jgi:D-3-phosphoglycerate dehydrogenase/(S)-sulfolactate dehydrogenase
MTNQNPVVLVCQPLLFQKSGTWRTILESAGLEVRFPGSGGKVLTGEQLQSELDGVTATIASTEPYTPSILQSAKNLRVVSRTGVGFDSIDTVAATERGVVVACTPGTNHDAVAEHAFALLLAVAKRIVPNHADVTGGGFHRQPSRALRGKTLGLIGFGRIGRAVARRAAAFQMKVLAHDPFLPAPPDDARDVALVTFEELLARSDIISLHAAATESTSRLIRRDTLAQMKQGVVLINTARGTLVDEPALREALQSGKVAAAGLDVFEHEPPAGSPLLSAPNVVLSPHLAGIDEQAFEDMATMAAQTIVDLCQGRWPAERLVNAGQLRQPWKWDSVT